MFNVNDEVYERDTLESGRVVRSWEGMTEVEMDTINHEHRLFFDREIAPISEFPPTGDCYFWMKEPPSVSEEPRS